jgi:transcriptional regulator with XRE-family HTH domain
MESNTTLLRIQELCNQRGWSLYKLAKESGIAYSSLNNIFIRNTQPTIPTLEKICNGFNITMSDFFNNDTHSDTIVLSPDEIELLECYRNISKQNKKTLKSFISFLSQ